MSSAVLNVRATLTCWSCGRDSHLGFMPSSVIPMGNHTHRDHHLQGNQTSTLSMAKILTVSFFT